MGSNVIDLFATNPSHEYTIRFIVFCGHPAAPLEATALMREIGGKISVLRHPEAMPGILIAAYFGFKLLAYIHLGLIGRVTPGMSGRLESERMPDPGGEVIYFYQVGELSQHGWRRGIQYGGQVITVVYSPIHSAFHVTSVKRGLQSPLRLWVDIDYWLRLGLTLLGVALGLLIAGFPYLWRNRTWRIMHGLSREDPLG